MINLIMTSLKIPESTQNRVLVYYDFKNSMKFVKNEVFYDLLNENLTKVVKLFQTEEAIRKIGLFDKYNVNQIEKFASLIKTSLYLPSDVVVKQGDIGDYFYVVIDGIAEVRSETKDFKYFDHDSTLKFLGDYVPNKGKNDSNFIKLKKYLKTCKQNKQTQSKLTFKERYVTNVYKKIKNSL